MKNLKNELAQILIDFSTQYNQELDRKQKSEIIDEQVNKINDLVQTEVIEKLIEEVPITPKHWNQWTIERQLGYNMAILDLKQQLRAKWLGNQNSNNI